MAYEVSLRKVRLKLRFCLGVLFLVTIASRAEAACIPNGFACLSSVDAVAIGQRLPLILVHGWNRDAAPGPPSPADWTNLIAYIANDATLRTQFKVYLFTYTSNVIDAVQLGQAFRDLTDQSDVAEPVGFGTKPLLIVAHSLGGLISRYAFQLPQQAGPRSGSRLGNRVARLITLGTPHHGSPFANGPAIREKLAALSASFAQLWDSLVETRLPTSWDRPNRRDLLWDNYDSLLNYVRFPSEQNQLLALINGSAADDAKIVAYAGSLSCGGFDQYCLVSTVFRSLFGFGSDGVVPVQSALFVPLSGPSRAALTRTLNGYNHTELHDGKGDTLLFDQLKADLLSAVPSSAAPGPPLSLTFSISASTLSLFWNAPLTGPAPTTYVIEAGSSSGLADLANFPTGNTATTFSTSGVPAGTYFVRVRAANASGAGNSSNEATIVVGSSCSAPPPSPAGLANAVAGSTVTLRWSPAPGATSYVVEAGSTTGASNLASLDTGNANATFVAPGVGVGVYFVRVRAKNACATSLPSNETIVRVQ